MTKRKSKKKEVEPEQTGTLKVVLDEAFNIPDELLFVPDDVKLERVKETLKQERIKKDKLALDFWLRHELGLGTRQIKKLWKKLDEIYKVK